MTRKKNTSDSPQKKTAKRGLASKVKRSPTARQKSYVMDLRIHSPASLGYLGIEGIDTAPAMVRLAKVKGLDLIALTDFYSADFIERVSTAAEDTKLTVIPGTSIRCKLAECDDVVLICLFQEGCGREHIEKFLYSLGVPESRLGDESYVVDLPFPRVLALLEEAEGLALPSRMDKTPLRRSVIPNLVEDYGFRAFDLAYSDTKQYFKKTWPELQFQLFSFSNAHALAQVGNRNARVKMSEQGFAGLRGVVQRELS